VGFRSCQGLDRNVRSGPVHHKVLEAIKAALDKIRVSIANVPMIIFQLDRPFRAGHGLSYEIHRPFTLSKDLFLDSDVPMTSVHEP
jgi:hypothetical protein